MIYVFDASFIGALIIPDEHNPRVKKMYDRIENEDEKHVPHLLWYEIASIFSNLIRHGRFSGDEVQQFFPRLAAFNLKTDFEAGVAYSQKLLRLCNDYHLSSYDAAYLELADRKKAVLCTLDKDLRAAAKKYGVVIL
ncbi:MAG: type II toxin-antitoxin system VapC family toxin [Treponema sp.]|jgi:predicted nucleic acid-binding protein|nr:type II toxin-antitoxin system VapC family toxin [Treponema sp.]